LSKWKVYEREYEKRLISRNLIHKLKVEDKDIDEFSDSEVTDLLGNKDIKHKARDLFDNYMKIVRKIYSLPLMTEPPLHN
jgi:hypothetical protein